MKHYLVWISLALLALTFAVLEGLIENLPQQFVQFNGLLTILSTMGLIGWTLKLQLSSFKKIDRD